MPSTPTDHSQQSTQHSAAARFRAAPQAVCVLKIAGGACVRLALWSGNRLGRLRTLHRNQQGTISIMSVFSLLMFTMLLIMISNVATHVDDKMRMQNGVDAAAYSGGAVLARGMNTLAFSNHLLTDVFALTAFLREGRDRNAESMTADVFDEWSRTAAVLQGSDFEKFTELGQTLDNQILLEQELVAAFGDLTARSSEYALPVFEYILSGDESGSMGPLGGAPVSPGGSAGGLIPRFQETVVMTTALLAQQATGEVAYRHGLRQRDLDRLPNPPSDDSRGPQAGVLWRTSVEPVGVADETDPYVRTLPVVNPDPYGPDFAAVAPAEFDLYFNEAVEQRRQLSKHYLEEWTRDKLRLFNREAGLSQFNNLWRILTCAALHRLLTEEYPDTNLPFQLRRLDERTIEQAIQQVEWSNGLSRRREMDVRPLITLLQNEFDLRAYLDRDFHFVATCYRTHSPERGPGMFRNPLAPTADAMTYAQVRLFLPRPRRYLVYTNQGRPPEQQGLGGTFGYDGAIDLPRPPDVPRDRSAEFERWPRENWPTHWDLLNQNWTVQLVPATAPQLVEILQTNPGGEWANFRVPNFGNADIRNLKQISPH